MTRRGVLAMLVLGLWLAGLGALVRREFFRPQIERLAEAAMRVNPGVFFYVVSRDDEQVGFASSTIDTTTQTITVSDYLLAEAGPGGGTRRATMRTDIELSRGLRMLSFEVTAESQGAPRRIRGRIVSDTVLVLQMEGGTRPPETRRLTLSGPILMPAIVPLAITLSERPRVGKRFTLPVFDPDSLLPRDLRFTIRAESLFIVPDSAVFDTTSRRWRGVLPDTIRAWQIAEEENGVFSGWVDAQGRVVRTNQFGFALQRQPHELAVENWRRDTLARPDERRP